MQRFPFNHGRLYNKVQYHCSGNLRGESEITFSPFFSLPVQTEENLMGMTSFREVLEKMLVIVVLPVRKSLRKEVELFSPHLVSNTCGLLASIVSELTASALGSEVSCCYEHAHTHAPLFPKDKQ